MCTHYSTLSQNTSLPILPTLSPIPSLSLFLLSLPSPILYSLSRSPSPTAYSLYLSHPLSSPIPSSLDLSHTLLSPLSLSLSLSYHLVSLPHPLLSLFSLIPYFVSLTHIPIPPLSPSPTAYFLSPIVILSLPPPTLSHSHTLSHPLLCLSYTHTPILPLSFSPLPSPTL